MGMTPSILLGTTSLIAAIGFLAALYQYSNVRKKLRKYVGAAEDLADAKVLLAKQESQLIEIRNKYEQLEQSINKLPFPLWIRDKDLKLCKLNRTYLEALNRDPNTPIAEDENLELSETSKMLSELAKKSQHEQSGEQHLIFNDKRSLFGLYEIPLEHNGGTVGFALSKSSEELMKEELDHYVSMQSDLLETSASAMAVYDQRMALKSFNQAFVHLWKFDQNWLETHPTYGEILEVLREKQKLPEQADFKHFKRDNLAMFTNLIKKHEEFYYLPDGRVLRVIVIPHAMGGLLFSYEDMTDRITLERSLHTLTSVKKSTIDHLFEGVAVFGQDGRLQLCNPAFASMWQLKESMLQSEPHLLDIIESTKPYFDAEDGWEAFKQELFSQTQIREISNRQMELNDNRVLECATIPLPDGASLIIYRDISDTIRVERALQTEKEILKEVSELKSRFLANMSYELRSPLTTIKGFSEVLINHMNQGMNEKQVEYINDIHAASLSLTTLIDSIIDVASIDAGYLRMDVAKTLLKDILEDVTDEITPKARSKKVIISTDLDSKTLAIWCDKKRLVHALVNIISFALKQVENGAELAISANKQDNDTVGVIISLNATNSKETPPVLPLEQETDIQLSIPIAQSIIELHGGKIKAERHDDGFAISCVLPKKHTHSADSRKAEK